MKNNRTAYLVLFVLAFLLYGNTIPLDYALDDAIVITDNAYTKKGFEGIKDHLTNDTFTGFFKKEKKLVSGGRYRPLSLITFSVEYELFGKNPHISHFINIVLYGLTGMLLYAVMLLLFPVQSSRWYLSMPFIAAVLFMVHPIHTEVVANIKGRDEMLTFLGAVGALYLTIKSIESNKKYMLLSGAGVLFFLGLLSKENAITFLVIVPVALFFFKKLTIKQSLLYTTPLAAATVVFLFIRNAVVGFSVGAEVTELMNNPFLGLTDGEKYATIFYTLLRYVELLFVPHPLTYDYYPYHVDVYSRSNWQAVFSLLLYIGLALYAILSLFKKKDIIGFGIIIFLSSISIVSNILFPIGAFMNERFIYISSFGFVIIIAYLLVTKVQKEYIRYGVLIVVFLLFSVKTVIRNTAWKDDYTLFTTDVKTSYNSAKSTCSAGGKLLEYAKEEADSVKKFEELKLSKQYLIQATKNYAKILSDGIYVDAELLLGNCYFEFGEYDSTLFHYKRILKKAPMYENAHRNALITIQHFDDIDKRIAEAEFFFSKNPNDFDLNYNLGNWYGQYKHDIDTAIYFFERAAYIKRDSKEALKNLGVAYGFKKRYEDAAKVLNAAKKIDNTDEQIYFNLALTYMYLEEFDNSFENISYLYEKHPENEQYRKQYLFVKQMQEKSSGKIKR